MDTMFPHTETEALENHLGLFENGREANINSTIAMVEDVLIELGHFLNDCREPDAAPAYRAWRVVKGSALVRIALIERSVGAHLRTSSVVMTLCDGMDERHLFKRLLSINSEIHGAAFALADRQIVLVAERPTLDLDRSEVLDLIRRVQDYADHYDDELVAEFGGLRGTGA